MSLQDLSDLLWAANGLNRPEEDKTAASSAQNAHDVDIYVFTKRGIHVYDSRDRQLNFLLSGDYRSSVMMPRRPRLPQGPPGPEVALDKEVANAPPPPPPSNPPIQIVLVSDSERFKVGSPELRRECGPLMRGLYPKTFRCFARPLASKRGPARA
ncbi:MAG: hypothetical protein ONB30_05815 [candidate division KSB1 bacterium]|nr:hypothetical protein [candidate division KSB1 bacterium]